MTRLDFKDFKLSKDILTSIERLGYKEPSEVQAKVIPLILKNNDVIAKSQTGTGKTAAFSIPICENIELEEREPQALVICPTRELAIQIKDDFINIGRFKRLSCTAVFGKEPIHTQINRLKQRVHVVAGTPGRIIDLIDRDALKLKNIRYLVIDEADEMLNMGFIDQVKSIINKIPKKRSTLLFSATISEKITDLCNRYMVNPVFIDIKSENPVTNRIKQLYYETDYHNKFDLLNKIMYTERPESAMIFCSTKKNVEDLTLKLQDRAYSCRALHGGMLQADRINTIKSFKKGEFNFLVCTDIAARGIDIDNITHIINYDIPMEKESYIHRMGRTGRAGGSGTCITFVTPRDYRFLKSIEEHFNIIIEKGEEISEEEAKKGKLLFKKASKSAPIIKEDKNEKLSKNITKIYLSAGKKKKIRPGDIAGAISSIDGVNSEDVGIIDIQDNFSYVEILSGKGNLVLEALKNKTIKGKNVRAEKAQK